MSWRDDIYAAPSVRRVWCVVCGRPAQNDHHVIPGARHATREHPESPTLSLCGLGNASGCHGAAHAHRLHFRFTDRWEYMWTDEPLNELDASEIQEGWRCIHEQG